MIPDHNAYVLLVDMDDTIENLAESWNKWLNDKYRLNTKVSDWKSWAMKTQFPTLTQEQIFEPLHTASFWKDVTPKPDAQTYLERLSNEGFPIYIVTASHPDTISYKVKYVLNRYFPYISTEQVITTYNKKLLRGWYLIDDAIHNFGGTCKGLLYTAPWNANETNLPKNVTRVTDWQSIYEILKKDYESYNIK